LREVGIAVWKVEEEELSVEKKLCSVEEEESFSLTVLATFKECHFLHSIAIFGWIGIRLKTRGIIWSRDEGKIIRFCWAMLTIW
jgi:hypothetical protein